MSAAAYNVKKLVKPQAKKNNHKKKEKTERQINIKKKEKGKKETLENKKKVLRVFQVNDKMWYTCKQAWKSYVEE